MSGAVISNLTGTGTASNEEVAWTPTQAYLDRSRLRQFMARHDIATYDDLLTRAAADPAWYWQAVAADLALIWSPPRAIEHDFVRAAPAKREIRGDRLPVPGGVSCSAGQQVVIGGDVVARHEPVQARAIEIRLAWSPGGPFIT